MVGARRGGHHPGAALFVRTFGLSHRASSSTNDVLVLAMAITIREEVRLFSDVCRGVGQSQMLQAATLPAGRGAADEAGLAWTVVKLTNTRGAQKDIDNVHLTAKAEQVSKDGHPGGSSCYGRRVAVEQGAVVSWTKPKP